MIELKGDLAHGAWVTLLFFFAETNMPVVQLWIQPRWDWATICIWAKH